RPNVGKSSIVNRLAGSSRVTVSPVPGTTRDAVDVVLTSHGRRVRLVDTAGLRRRSKVAAADESIGILLTRRRLQRSHVAVLVIDAAAGLTSQDVGIVGEIVRLGRPFLIAANKWDLVESREAATKKLRETLQRRLAFATYAPFVTISAETGQRVSKVIEIGCEVGDAASREVKTAALNRFLERLAGERVAGGASRPRLLYITQVGTLPPRFAVFCRDPAAVSRPFLRFLERRLREEFGLGPTPVVVSIRRSPRKR
ncbi:MAG: GTP-binding protein, partial [Acidobacteriota bacterium]|nr:GTP-binding protein [Acidobacteriota bacterium]